MSKLNGVLLALLCGTMAAAQPVYHWVDGVTISFGGHYGQMEVGGPFVGMEFHKSRPLPSRISFYSPVANSIDLSTDYWRRDESRPMVVGVKVDDGERRWLGKEPWDYAISPHVVRFARAEGDLEYAIRYQFCLDEPGAVATISITNHGRGQHSVELYSHLKISLRTCQTYARFDRAVTRYDARRHALVAEFREPETALAAVAVQNMGEQPVMWTSSAEELAVSDSGASRWIMSAEKLQQKLFGVGRPGNALAAFIYQKILEPEDSLVVVQVISSMRSKEASTVTARLAKKWRDDVKQYESLVRNTALKDSPLRTGDAWLDSSASYARAILVANQHYLDGSVVPMPCPAEYNFFFTHDVLQTNLSAINFDPQRARRDLLYIAKHAKDGIIPHAYYWRDDGFKTEYCSPGNWNHPLFVMVSGAYLRHTMDAQTIGQLYPLITKSIQETLRREKGGVMHGTEPDWWDFGKVDGARAYLTILTVRALQEYMFISAFLGKNLTQLAAYEQRAETLRNGLEQTLWDDTVGYLLNYNGAAQDRHIYMGPLLAPVYGLLPPERARRLVETAGRMLLDHPVGVRTVYPADFHIDSIKQFFKVSGNEAGNQYLYANGGVWYLGNAWFAAALRGAGRTDDALDFFKRTMTLDGIIRSPMGQPALYEYRFADADAPDHGWVDKPTMMWSGGFCLGTMYRLLGIQDNPWNITVAGVMPSAFENVSCSLAFGLLKHLERTGKGSRLTQLLVDDREIPSRVLPLDAARGSSIKITQGPIRFPYIDSLNAVLHSASFDKQTKTLTCTLSSYEGHRTFLAVDTPWLFRRVLLNGKPMPDVAVSSDPLGMLILNIRFAATSGRDKIEIHF
jgi:glycogen debranching enzyme